MTVDTETLKRWRQGLERDMAQLRERLKPLQDELQRKQAQLSAVEQLMAAATGPAADGDRRCVIPPRNSNSFLDDAYEVLREEGGPLHYQQLHSRLVGRGSEVPGNTPAANLLTHMNRDKRFIRVARGTYGIHGRDKARPRSPAQRRSESR